MPRLFWSGWKFSGGDTGYAVTLSRREVMEFKTRWPASGLPNVGVTFHFQSNGDLVDITPYRMAHLFDGPAAVALSQDAQEYARFRMAQRSKTGR